MASVRVVKHQNIASHVLPASLAREIGRFIVAWAHFEHYVQAIVWNCLNLSEELGRITVREPRLTDRLDMIRDICEFANIETDFVLLASIKNAATPLAAMRHLLAHGLWFNHESRWHVMLTRGAWERRQADIPDYPKGSKTIYPQGIWITPQEIAEWRVETERLLAEAPKIFDKHVPLPQPSPQKSRARSAEGNPTRGRGSRKPKPPPRS